MTERHAIRTLWPVVAAVAVLFVCTVVIDRFYVAMLRNQLKTAGEASAFAGAMALRHGEATQTDVDVAAIQFVTLNDPTPLDTIVIDDIVMGKWDFVRNTFLPTSVEPNAVLAKVHRNAATTFSPLMIFKQTLGSENSVVSATVIAAFRNNGSGSNYPSIVQ